MKKSIYGMTYEQLQVWLVEHGEKKISNAASMGLAV